MNISQASQRIVDLRLLLSTYEKLYTDLRSSFYCCDSLKPLIRETKRELEYLEEMRENGEFWESQEYKA